MCKYPKWKSEWKVIANCETCLSPTFMIVDGNPCIRPSTWRGGFNEVPDDWAVACLIIVPVIEVSRVQWNHCCTAWSRASIQNKLACVSSGVEVSGCQAWGHVNHVWDAQWILTVYWISPESELITADATGIHSDSQALIDVCAVDTQWIAWFRECQVGTIATWRCNCISFESSTAIIVLSHCPSREVGIRRSATCPVVDPLVKRISL